uniref:Phosphatase 2A Regulatory Subunit A helical domain-containing protein n=1 Tax=Pygocentrus nattereri TaxID=42514 RepID=A0AAR2LCG9_PYGNA
MQNKGNWPKPCFFFFNSFFRQIVARGLLDVLREFSDNENDFISVMETVVRMSEDAEPTVRAELMEQVPNIAMFLHENRPNFPAAFSRYLVPIVVRYLTDPNNQVRKTSQAALLVLLEQGLICKADMEGKICPVLLELTEPSSDDDYKIEAVAIMCKLVTMLNKDTVELLLLLRFCELCSDARLFQVRKVCAANFGEFCSIVGQDATEKLLMPKFFDLCSDSLWGIRKACAECFMVVSNCTSPEVRRTKLSPLFINLISDQSRWVRQAAFQSLGRFISTFANPSSTGVRFQEDETLHGITKSTEKNEHKGSCSDASSDRFPGSSASPGKSKKFSDTVIKPSQASEDPNHSRVPSSVKSHTTDGKLGQPDSLTTTQDQQTGDFFDSFHYWRPLLPDISQDLELLQGEGKDEVQRQEMVKEEETVPDLDSEGPATSSQIQKVLECLQPHLDDPDVQADRAEASRHGDQDNEHPRRALEMDTLGMQKRKKRPTGKAITLISVLHIPHVSHFSLSSFLPSFLQNVIPQQLLDQYLSMTDPVRAQTVDTEIAKHCAFSLPGVALTLGRQNWHCLKDTYETLATDVQWKVRRTLAFSIHELAVILGDQLTAADLVPIFNGFLKDLDEVRIGVLKHLYDFLKLLHVEKRREYLYQLQEFMVTDNSRNWRFRYELAEQLILIIDLYSHYDVYDYLRQIALSLCSDKVSDVRWISYKLVVEILQKLYSCGAHDLSLNFINELVVRFCHCPKWVGRQAFAFICQAIVEEDCMPMDQFAQHLLPCLLSLSSDPVPNVRVLVAKALRHSVLEKRKTFSRFDVKWFIVENLLRILNSGGDGNQTSEACNTSKSIHTASCCFIKWS